MSKKILITREIPAVGVDLLTSNGFEVTTCPSEPHAAELSHEEFISFLKRDSYDAIITMATNSVNKEILNAAPQLKIIAQYAAGFNNIDFAETKKRNIVVTNTPGVSSRAVAEHAVALMLALTTRIVEADAFVRKGKYKGWSPLNFMGTDLTAKTIGLIGVGGIGTEVAHIVTRGFNVKILYYDVARNENLEKEYGAIHSDNVEDVLKQADIVSLHVPLLDSTKHLINSARLNMMKKTSFLINTARGPVVDEKALVEALQNKTIAGAALDVFEFEPELTPGLAQLPNVILTPHIASARDTARNEMALIAAQNIIDFFQGKTPKNQVNR